MSPKEEIGISSWWPKWSVASLTVDHPSFPCPFCIICHTEFFPSIQSTPKPCNNLHVDQRCLVSHNSFGFFVMLPRTKVKFHVHIPNTYISSQQGCTFLDFSTFHDISHGSVAWIDFGVKIIRLTKPWWADKNTGRDGWERWIGALTPIFFIIANSCHTLSYTFYSIAWNRIRPLCTKEVMGKQTGKIISEFSKPITNHRDSAGTRCSIYYTPGRKVYGSFPGIIF